MKPNKNPDYKKIYSDILQFLHPEKNEACKSFMSKDIFSVQDVIKINTIIFGKRTDTNFSQNQKYRSYDERAILEILDYQKKHKLNNMQLAQHFSLSRNTVTKWRKIFNN
ncbi:helix-turn-helix domain-containing protein [Chryseobacterium sp. OSA05B]|uniref:helix-turn-helix domain-containing protein n=1 Tax=Chryseobacterium sp. OSA05B TaxID=2862650 RepID=UPI001CBED82B|nr:helix-turn-helix domain-containing protein [Chryseobacterium sp. OSA05B]